MKQAWEIKKLGEVCEIANGSTPLRSNKEFWENGDFPWFTIDDIREQGRIIRYTKQSVTQAALNRLRVLPVDTVLLCCTASIGEYAITEIELTSNQQFNGLIVKDYKTLLPLFLLYFISTLKDKLSKLSGKTTIDFIPISRLKDIEVPLPPLPEQQSIVAILDETFASIAKAKAKAEQNLKNAKELFESYLQSVFTNKGAGWKEKTLGEVCEIKPPKTEVRNKLKKTDLVSFVPMEDLGINKKLFTPTKERQLSQVEGSYTYFANEDVLLAKITPCFENGKLGIARDLRNGVGFGSSEFIVFRVSKIIDSEFLYYFLSRQQLRTEGAVRMMGAVGHKRVLKEFIDNYSIPFPPLEEQSSIVQKLDSLSVETKKLEAIYQQKLNNLEELKKSILQKAFNGALKTEKALVV